MPRNMPPHCEQWFDRHGKLRIYFRLGKGKRIPLPDNPNSDDFKQAYAEALGGAIASRRYVREKPKEGTIGALILSYQKSLDYHDLRETTKVGYQSRLNILSKQHGHRTVSGLTQERIEEKILEPFKDRPGQRLAILKMLRILIQHAMKKKWLLCDPSRGIKRPKTGSIRSWTEEEISQFENRWPIGTRERLGFALMLFSGQRRSDAHRMTWTDTTVWTITVVQQKTGTKLIIPIHRDLRKILDVTPREQITILNTAFGRSFTVDGFSQFMRDAIKGAGLPLECQPHGLRKAAGRRLAEAGCGAKEIMAILGHKTMSEAQRYVDDADQTRLAAAAIKKLEKEGAFRD